MAAGSTTTGRVHASSSGFAWEVRYPERTVVPMGARKPLACVLAGEGPRRDELVRVPVAVARALERGEGAEPSCRSELLHRVGEVARACAFQRVVDMVSRREYASSEARTRLERDGYAAATATAAVVRAQELRIVDDARYAESFVRSKLACGWGPSRIARELGRWDLSLDDVPGWPDELMGDEDELQRACDLLARRRVPDTNAYPKLMRFLVSRGYRTSVARDAVERVLAGAD